MPCEICRKEAEPKAVFCTAHRVAFENLHLGFGRWTHGYGRLSLTDFLVRIEKIPGTGKKVRELAQFILENPSRWA